MTTEGNENAARAPITADLIESLGLLGRNDEALALFDRVIDDSKREPDGTFDAKAFAAAATTLASMYQKRGDTEPALPWCERSITLQESLVSRTPTDELALLIEVLRRAFLHAWSAGNARAAAEARGEALPPSVAADLELALASGKRVAAFAEDPAAVGADGYPFIVAGAWIAADALFVMDRAAEALEWFEKADAYMERFGLSRGEVARESWKNAMMRGRCLVALDRRAEAVPWFERARAEFVPGRDAEANEDQPDELAARILEIREEMGVPHGLDPETLVRAMAWLAMEGVVQGRAEDGASWFERGEAARKAASMPPRKGADRDVRNAYLLANDLEANGQKPRAARIRELFSDLCHEIGHVEGLTRDFYEGVLLQAAGDALSRAFDEMESALSASPPRIDDLRNLLVAPIRRLDRAMELLGAERNAEIDDVWILCHTVRVMGLEQGGELAEALASCNRVLARHEEGRVVMEPSKLDEFKMTSARLQALLSVLTASGSLPAVPRN